MLKLLGMMLLFLIFVGCNTIESSQPEDQTPQDNTNGESGQNSDGSSSDGSSSDGSSSSNSAPVLTSFIINSNQSITNSNTLNLSFDSTNASEIYLTLSSDCSTGGEWIEYVDSISFDIPEAYFNTTAEIYAKVKNEAGDESECLSKTIEHDNTAPTSNSISINSGASYTNSTSVTLTLASVGASEMYVTNTAGCGSGGNWEPYSTSKAWTIIQVNAKAWTYVKFKDLAGNESTCKNDSITHDSIVPVLNNTVVSTSSSSVSVSSSSSGAFERYLTKNAGCGSGGTWEQYSSSFTYTILDEELNSVIYLYTKVKDAAGNESLCKTITITHDNIPPANPSVSIENGALKTNKNPNVILNLSADGASNYIAASTEELCQTGTSWSNYSATVYWAIPQTNATLTVYVKFRDAVGNESACVSDSIEHENVIPVISGVVVNGGQAYAIDATPIPIEISVSEEISHVAFPSYCSEFSPTWIPVSSSTSSIATVDFSYAHYGRRIQDVRVKDLAGNVSSSSCPNFTIYFLNSAILQYRYPFGISNYLDYEYSSSLGANGCQDIVYDSSGNIYCSGMFALTKIKPDGTIDWVQKFKTGTSTGASGIGYLDTLSYTWNFGFYYSDIALYHDDADGGEDYIYVAAYTIDSIFDTNSNNYDPIFMKFKSDGSHVWSKQIGDAYNPTYDTTSSTEIHDIAVDSNGNLFAVGETQSSFAVPNSSNPDPLIMKFNEADGSISWVKQFKPDYGGTTLEGVSSCYSVAIDRNDDVYCAGKTSSSLGETNSAGMNLSNTDAFVIKVANSNGATIWAQQLGYETMQLSEGTNSSTGEDQCKTITVDGNLNVYCAGITYSNLKETNAGNADIFVWKISQNETGVTPSFGWVSHLGSTSVGAGADRYEECTQVLNYDEYIYCTGYTKGSLVETNQGLSNGYKDIIILKMNASDGNLTWLKQLGMESRDSSSYIAGTYSNDECLSADLFIESDGSLRISCGGIGNSSLTGDMWLVNSPIIVNWNSNGELVPIRQE